MVKAVHPTTGQILGWGAAKMQGSAWDSGSSEMEKKKEGEGEMDVKKGMEREEGAKVGEKAGGDQRGEETELSKMVAKEEKQLLRVWFKGRRWLYLAALFTEPEWQGKGVGSAVIERLCERADREGAWGG